MIKKLIFLVLMASVLITCRSAETNKIRGRLIYSVGGKIFYVDFSTPEMKPKVIYQGFSHSSHVSRITKIDDNALIFYECITGKCSIKLLDIKTGHEQTLRSGRLPTYVPDHDRLFFYDYDQSKGNRKRVFSSLFSSSLKNPDIAEKIDMAPDDIILKNKLHRRITAPVVSISTNEVVFNGNDRRLWIYNIPMSKIISTYNKNCEPIVWRSETQQLLCRDWETRKVFLLDINKKTKEELQDLKKGYSFLYVPEYDALIYNKARFRFPFGEAYDLFVYFFKNKKEEKIKSNFSIKSGFYIP